MLLGAARYLAETRDFAGTVTFIFQPAEEGLGGARAMIADGLFEGDGGLPAEVGFEAGVVYEDVGGIVGAEFGWVGFGRYGRFVAKGRLGDKLEDFFAGAALTRGNRALTKSARVAPIFPPIASRTFRA